MIRQHLGDKNSVRASANQNMQVRALRSTDDPASGYRRIEATVHAMGRHDVQVEKLAGQLTLEYGITNVEWEYGNKGCENRKTPCVHRQS